MIARLVIVIALALPTACSEQRSKRCEDVCQREADCADELDDDEVVVNKSECVRECNELEREPGGPALVTEHLACVMRAPECGAVLQCQ